MIIAPSTPELWTPRSRRAPRVERARRRRCAPPFGGFSFAAPHTCRKVASTFDPSTLTPSAWWVGGDYLYTEVPEFFAQWDDSSGNSRHLSGSTSSTAPAETTLNSLDIPDFDGTDDQLTNASALSTLLTVSGYGGWCLFRANSVDASSSASITTTPYGNDGVFGDTGGYFGIYLRNNSGTYSVQLYHFASASNGLEFTISLSTWYLLAYYYDGTNLRASLDGGSVQTIALGNLNASSASSTFRMGTGWSAVQFADVTVAECATKAGSGMTDTNIQTDLPGYVLATYNE